MAAILPTVANAIDLLLAGTQAMSQIATLVQDAKAAGQTILTTEQWATITGNEDSAEAALIAAIATAKAQGK